MTSYLTLLKEKLFSFATDRRNRSVAIWTLLFSFLAHGFRWFSITFLHDSLMVNHHSEILQQIYLGRWLAPLWLFIRGEISIPLLIAVFFVCFLILAIILLVRILDIRRTHHIALLCALLSANPTMALLNGCHIYITDVYTLSLLFSIAAVWFFLEFRRGWIPACFALAGAIAVYPPYVEVAILLLMFLMIKDLVNGNNTLTKDGKGLKMVAFLVLGGILYYGIWLLVVRLLTGAGVSALPTAGDYNSLNRLNDFRLSNLPALLKGTYAFWGSYVSFPETVHPYIMGIVNLLLAAGAYILTVTSARKPLRLIPATGLFLLIPLGANFVYILSGGMVHNLMIYSFSFTFAGIIMCMEFSLPEPSGKFKRRIHSLTRTLMTIALCAISLSFIISANQFHVKCNLESQATLSVMTRILDRMEQTEDYEPGKTPVVFVGDLNDSAIAQIRSGYDGLRFKNKTSYFNITYYEGNSYYLNDILGYPILLLDRDASTHYAQMDEVAAMPAFPSPGCIRMIDDTLVVKLSESMAIY